MKQLILASQSVSRKEILDRAGIEFTVDPSNYEEDMTLPMEPAELAIHLSQGKARDVAKRHKNAVIIGADSFAVAGNELLGKPQDQERAKEMLRMLSGNEHTFVTGYTIIDADSGKEVSGSQTTKIFVKKLTDEQIDNYLSREDVMGKAAAYSLQNLGGALIEKVEGDPNNACGLPLAEIIAILPDFGISII
jgi:septum formation protein